MGSVFCPEYFKSLYNDVDIIFTNLANMFFFFSTITILSTQAVSIIIR